MDLVSPNADFVKNRNSFLRGLLYPLRLLAFIAVILIITESAFGQAMVVSSYFNANDMRDEWTELLVIQDNLDIRNWTIGDNNTTQTGWQPRIAFNPINFWRNLRAGTIIVIWHRPVNSSLIPQPEDTDPSDGFIQLRVTNATYFSGGDLGTAPNWNSGTSLNIAATGDIIQIRNGSAAHVHALGHQLSAGPDFIGLPNPKLNHSETMLANEAVFVCPGATLADYGTNAPQIGTTYTARAPAPNETRGLPNSCTASATANSDFWRQTRQPLWNSPVLTGTVNGTNTQINLNWNACVDPYSTDNTTGYLILRNTTNVFTDPVDGTNYSVGANLGSAVVLANLTGSANTSFSDNNAVPCLDGFYYRIYPYRFGQDNLNGNSYNTARGRAYNESQFAAAHITVSAEAPSSVGADQTEYCSGSAPATITLTATGGSGETMEWFSGSCGGTLIGNTNPLTIASPSVTTTYFFRWNSTFCGPSACEQVTVTVNPSITPTVSVTPSANPVCAGTQVTFTAIVSGGGAAPAYAWYIGGVLQGGQTANTFTYSPANGDQVTAMVTPTELCGVPVTSAGVTMVVNPVPTISAIGNNPVFCGQNGSITFNFTNVPNGTYTINYQTGSFPNVNVVNNAATISAAPGAYLNFSITVNGCTSIEDVDITIVSPTGSVISNVLPTGATCGNSNGSIIVTAAGGTAPIEYSIDNGVNWQSSPVFNNLAPGSYTVVVRDAALCETLWGNNPVTVGNTGGATINQVIPTNATCGGSNGSIDITASGGTAPLEYSINNGTSWQSSPVFNGLPAGNYTIIVRDGTLCETQWGNNPVVLISTGGATITQVIATDASCGSSNGSINITASGGTNPLEYSINSGSTWQSSPIFNGLNSGNYMVVVRDGTFCETLWPGNPVLVNNIGGATISQVTANGTTCGNSNGSISITASGGAPLEYSIDNGATWQSSEIFNGLAAGSYNVVVRDGTLCETLWASNPVVLNNTSGAAISSVNFTDASCGTSNGTIVINTTGGTAPLEYSINNGVNWQSSSVFSGLAAGSYAVTVRDGALCVTLYAGNPVIVGNTGGATIAMVASLDATCNNSNGSITVTASGVAPLEYSINNGASWQSSSTFNGLIPGTYNVIVRDGLLCMTPYSGNPVIVNSADGAAINQVNKTDATCSSSNGSITINANGVAPIEYSINNGVSWQLSPVFNSLPSGNYTIIVRDGALCETLWNNNPVIINSTGGAAITTVLPTNATCGNDNGSISISAEDGVAPLAYSIDNGLNWQSLPLFNDLNAGSYHVIVRDFTGCETIYSGNPLIISNISGATISGVDFPNTICFGENATISITTTGGTAPFDYSINNGITWQSNPVFTGLSGGNYTIKVRDAEMCETNYPTTVVINVITGPAVSVTLSSNAASVCQGEEVVFTAEVPVNVGPTPVYRWLVNGVMESGSGNTFNYVPANGDQVVVEVTSTELCATNNPATDEETVDLSPCGFVMRIPNSFTPNNDMVNDIFKPVLGDILPTKYLLQVFDRWGGIVFETNNPDQGWDGTHKGQPVPGGIYSYKLEFEIPEYISSSLENPIRGTIILLR
jgi:gliding motility-associated-like protein